jgi:hypothetical protein
MSARLLSLGTPPAQFLDLLTVQFAPALRNSKRSRGVPFNALACNQFLQLCFESSWCQLPSQLCSGLGCAPYEDRHDPEGFNREQKV